jgi:serine/threonine protein kinase
VTSLEHPRYHQDRLIAVGGMGEVWEATDTVLRRQVALKVLKKEYADDATFRARFDAEAKHAAALSHPNVASVLDYGEVPGGAPGEPDRPYLVMELVRGEPLSTLLKGGRSLDPRRAAELIAQAATGIHAAHRLGIVHRDVKPGNLLVTPDGQVKVTDFGIARAADAVPLTLTGQVIGTPHYLSPEQAEGKEATPASDVYALAVVLYECLAGQRPFTSDSPVGVALAHVRDPAPELPAHIPAALRAVVAQSLSKDPAARPQSAAALAEILRGDLDDATRVGPPAGAAVGAAGVAGAATVAATAVAPGPSTQSLATDPPTIARSASVDSTPSRRSRRPSPLVLGLVAIALLVLGLWAASALLGGEEEPTQTPSADATAGESAAGPSEPAASEPAPDESVPDETAPSDPEPTETEPETVTVEEDDYLGADAKDAEKQLKDLGLKPQQEKVDNDGTQEEGTVASVSPTGEVPEGTVITLGVYDKPVEEPEVEVEPGNSGSSGGAGENGNSGQGGG